MAVGGEVLAVGGILTASRQWYMVDETIDGFAEVDDEGMEVD